MDVTDASAIEANGLGMGFGIRIKSCHSIHVKLLHATKPNQFMQRPVHSGQRDCRQGRSDTEKNFLSRRMAGISFQGFVNAKALRGYPQTPVTSREKKLINTIHCYLIIIVN